ncbi:hypothetical protein [Marinobacterium stanieri]|uniref:Uncharacterized protein n=1 Tax=Marinobacterium stanieri TaxID=49186 RepID=A0A1N6XB08_9GAMM|nr:hypothetical protein [Marinobacterium stanieri]SIQ99544.1 hypothetical protein SAMN05421647_11360 [Marinobacterium stanieri]
MMESIENHRFIADQPERYRPDVKLLAIVKNGAIQLAFCDTEKSLNLNGRQWNHLYGPEASYITNHWLDFDPDGFGFAGGASTFNSNRLKTYRVG